MTLGMEMYNLIEDESFFNESLDFDLTKNEEETATRTMVRFFHEAINTCNDLIDMYKDEYTMYSEAGGVGQFFKDLGAKIKTILTKIFEWLKNAVKVIGKILTAPFGLIFRKSESKNGGGGGGAASSSGDKSTGAKDANTPTPSTPAPAGSFGSATSPFGILAGMCDGGNFEFKYIKDTGYKDFFNPVEVMTRMIKLAESKELLNSVDKSILKESISTIADSTGNVLDGKEQLKDEYIKSLKELTGISAKYKDTIFMLAKSDRTKIDKFLDVIKKTINGMSDKSRKDVVGNSDDIFDTLFSGNYQKWLLLLNDYKNTKIDWCSGIKSVSDTKDKITAVANTINSKRNFIAAMAGLDSSGITTSDSLKGDMLIQINNKIEALTNQISSSSDEESKKILNSKLAISNKLKSTIDSANNENAIIAAVKEYVQTIEKSTGNTSTNDYKKTDSDTFSKVEKSGDDTVFKILSDSYSTLEYEVTIRSMVYSKLLEAVYSAEKVSDGMKSFVKDELKSELSQLQVALAGCIDTFSSIKATIDKDITTLADKKDIGIKAQTSTPDPTGENKDTLTSKGNSKDFDVAVVGLVKASLGELKEQITGFINEFTDIEKHSRLSYSSIIHMSYTIDAYRLQQKLVYENMLAKALFGIKEKVTKDKEELMKDTTKVDKAKAKDNAANIEYVGDLEKQRAVAYAAIKKNLGI